MEREFWRASYHQERDAFIVEEAGWLDGQARIEYRFVYDNEIGEGGLSKFWLDDEGDYSEEFYTFGEYASEEEFREAVQAILTEAQAVRMADNLDFFMAVLDEVKSRAVDADFDDEGIYEVEGLFGDGEEDAYTQHSLPDQRLHDRVERPTDECWRLHIGQVVDAQQKQLGWAVFVLLYPDLTSSADEYAIAQARHAEILDLGHFLHEADAHQSLAITQNFMNWGERVDDPIYAFMNDSEIFEFMSLKHNSEKTANPNWIILSGDDLQNFLAGAYPIVRESQDWYPRELVVSVAEEMGLPLHLADQLYARLLASSQLDDTSDETNKGADKNNH